MFMTKNRKSADSGSREVPHFQGLWLCRKTTPDENGLTFRHALLFALADGKPFLLRFNNDDSDAGGVTFTFAYDYRVTPNVIHQHPIGYPKSFAAEIPWIAGEDGSLTLRYDEDADRFFPATWDEVFSLGFERDEIEEALKEAADAGWRFTVDPSFPEFAKARPT
jgi:hypothetical protein